MGAGRFILFMCGQLGVNLVARFFFQWLTYFADKGGRVDGDADVATGAVFTAAAVSAVFLGFRVFDAVTDPVAGTLSDAWVRRGRQRRSLLWLSFFMPSIGLAMIFAPTASMGPALAWTLLCVGMLVFFVGYTLYAIPYWSLVDDYSQGDADRRRWLSNLLGIGVLLATGLGFGVSPMLVESLGFYRAALAFAGPAALLMILPYFASPPPRADRPSPKPIEAGDEPGPIEAFRVAFRDRAFLSAVLLFSGAQMAFTVITGAAAFIVTRLLGGSEGDVALLLGPLLLVSIVSLLGVPTAARRYGWRRVAGFGAVALAIVYMASATLGMALIGSPLTTAAVVFALAGPMVAILVGLEGEAVAASAQATGEEVTSVYFGVFNLVVKGLNGVALALQGALATLASGPMGTTAVRLMGLVAGVLLLAGMAASALVRPRSRA